MKSILNIKKLCYSVLALALMFTINSCSTEEINSLQQEDTGTVNDDMSRKSNVRSASGQGGLIFTQGEGGLNGYQSFSFNVKLDANGNVSGSWQSNYNDSEDDSFDVNTHGTIECVTFVGDNQATMSGTITKFKAGEFWDAFDLGNNDKVYFEVIDNGQGKNAAPDQFSDVYVGLAGLVCRDANVTLLDISNGNIQVK